MKLFNLILSVSFSVILSSHTLADESNVFCSKPDGSHWDWLENDNEEQVVIDGSWVEREEYRGDYFLVIRSSYLDVNQQCKTEFGSQYLAQPAKNSLSSWYKFMLYDEETNTYSIAAGYIPPTNSMPRISDINLKLDIQPLQNSLDKLSRLNGYSYSWRPDSIQGHLAGQYEYGIIAQEVQSELPELVEQYDPYTLRVDYIGFIPVLLESIKELKTRVETLESQQ
ncbi:tail fiber domain-containing protein [Vibrio pectenicida]|uniref:Tail fiber domain-containing protein n=1 Tax=Vibrio pectenicida TaxID=62763 RepID=A0A427U7S1_9VIBR|nr:tail fiber domain-containing protein [Vibrio pectenicida]RSD32552.1 tail fiber domain-containing protein [Vibrio pectenicida]